MARSMIAEENGDYHVPRCATPQSAPISRSASGANCHPAVSVYRQARHLDTDGYRSTRPADSPCGAPAVRSRVEKIRSQTSEVTPKFPGWRA